MALGWLRRWFWPRIKLAVAEWSNDEAAQLSAATSYYAALAFFPLLLVLIAFLGFALRVSPTAQSAEEELIAVVSQTASPSLGEQVRQILGEVKTGAGFGGPIGLVALLVVVTGLFDQIDNAFAKIWRVRSKPIRGFGSFLRRVLFERFKAFLMFLVLGLLVLAIFFAGLASSFAKQFVPEVAAGERTWDFLGIAATVFFNTLIFGMIYKVRPGTPIRWRDLWPGALLAAVIWEVGRQVLAILVVGSKYSAYGVVGSFIAMMVWVYYASAVIYFGAEFVKVSDDLRKRDE